MKKAILIFVVFTSGVIQAQTASKNKMSGSSTEDHMQAMMKECMRMNNDEKICQQQMSLCRKNMSDPVCDKIHQSMKKEK